MQYRKQLLNATMKSTDGAGQTETASSNDGTNANESPETNAGEGRKKRKRKGHTPASVPPPIPRAQQKGNEKNNGARQRKEGNPAQDTPTQQHGDTSTTPLPTPSPRCRPRQPTRARTENIHSNFWVSAPAPLRYLWRGVDLRLMSG